MNALNRPKQLMLAGLLAAMGTVAFAQGTPPAAPPAGSPPPQHRMHDGMHKPDPAKFAEHMAKRQADLKAKLKITASQEGAWTAFTDSMKPPANRPARPDRAEFEKLTTPQRIDRMQAMKAQRDAEMAKRADATKTFYAALTPEQQKTFDAESLKMHRHGGHHGGSRGPGAPGAAPANPATPK